MVEDSDGDILLHSEYFLLKKAFAEEDHTVTFTIPIQEPLPPQYFVRVRSRLLLLTTWLQLLASNIELATSLPVPLGKYTLPPLWFQYLNFDLASDGFTYKNRAVALLLSDDVL